MSARRRAVGVASTVGDALCAGARRRRGLAPDQPSAGMHRDGFGLLSLQSAHAWPAAQVASAPGTGTRVTVTIRDAGAAGDYLG
ncbi:MAG: hypothetical protein U0Z44_02975 [Kouleothrix sp.]